MRIQYLALTSVLLAAMLWLGGCSSIPGHNGIQRPQAFAASRSGETSSADRYPLTNTEIQQMILRNNPGEMRAHGWAILNALVSSNPVAQDGNSEFEAAWDSESQPWENKCTLGLGGTRSSCAPPKPISGRDCELPEPGQSITASSPIEMPVQQMAALDQMAAKTIDTPPSTAPQFPAFISTVRYNSYAAEFIRKHCLYLASKIRTLTSADQFDQRSVIVKLIWATPDKFRQIPVWNPSFADKARFPDGPPRDPSDWPQVRVAIDDPSPCSSTLQHGFATSSPAPSTSPASNATPPPVPINCFYHRRYPCALLNNAIKPSAIGSVHHCPIGQFFAALLMGVHIITAEQHDWVWTTFWWTPDPGSDPGHRDQPESFANRGQWWYYAMDTAMSPTTPLAQDGLAHIAFNPYIEGPNPNSTVSNCMFCHRMAVIRNPGSPITAIHEIQSGSPPRCGYRQRVPAKCLQSLLPSGASYYVGAAATHFLWSVADNQDQEKRGDINLLETIQGFPIDSFESQKVKRSAKPQSPTQHP